MILHLAALALAAIFAALLIAWWFVLIAA